MATPSTKGARSLPGSKQGRVAAPAAATAKRPASASTKKTGAASKATKSGSTTREASGKVSPTTTTTTTTTKKAASPPPTQASIGEVKPEKKPKSPPPTTTASSSEAPKSSRRKTSPDTPKAKPEATPRKVSRPPSASLAQPKTPKGKDVPPKPKGAATTSTTATTTAKPPASSTSSASSASSASSSSAAHKPPASSASSSSAVHKPPASSASSSSTAHKPPASSASSSSTAHKPPASGGSKLVDGKNKSTSALPTTADKRGASSSSSKPPSRATSKPTSKAPSRTTSNAATPRSPKGADGKSKGKGVKSPRSPRSAVPRAASHPALKATTHVEPKLPDPRTNESVLSVLDSKPAVARIGTIRKIAPTNRRKASSNPVKAMASKPQVERPSRQDSPMRSASSSYMAGMGMLASLVGNGPVEFNNIQLRKVSEERPKVVFIHVKGRRRVVARMCQPVASSMNKGDVFVLVDPSTRKIYEWRGSQANKMEVAKGMDLSGRIKNKEFGGRAEIFVLTEGKNDNTHPEFWANLGGKPQKIAEAKHAGEDEEEDKRVHNDVIIGFVEKAAGKFSPHEVGRQRLLKDMLQTGHAFVVDCGCELYMWVGRGVSSGERAAAAAKAQELEVKGRTPRSGSSKGVSSGSSSGGGGGSRPAWVSIMRVIEGAEPEIFKEKFADWPSTLPITMAAIPKGRIAEAKPQPKFDVASMYTPFVHPADKTIETGPGTIQVWRVKDHDKDEVPRELHGRFFTSESYVILHTYIVKNREAYIIYFWQGKKSSIHEKGSSALLTIDLDDTIGGSATQIRVVQNKESRQFMSLFNGNIIVHKGTPEEALSAEEDTSLYQIRTFNAKHGQQPDVRAIQLSNTAAKNLNSNDCFLLNTPEKQFLWKGSASSKFCDITFERLSDVGLPLKGDREQVFVEEGNEPDEFWQALTGGRQSYTPLEWLWRPRMYHCSCASGSFVVEEIPDWDQDDLDIGHINIFDTGREIYLWLGQRAAYEEEKRLAMETVLQYAQQHPLRKGKESEEIKESVLMVRCHREPHAFTRHFVNWDGSKSLLKNGEAGLVVRVEDLFNDLTRVYTLEELVKFPKMLEYTKLESYLGDEEFERVFQMDKPTFYTQPLWKQEEKKKKVGLY